jgi:hypothetical protein
MIIYTIQSHSVAGVLGQRSNFRVPTFQVWPLFPIPNKAMGCGEERRSITWPRHAVGRGKVSTQPIFWYRYEL